MKRTIIVVFLVLLTSGVANGVILRSKHDLKFSGNTVRTDNAKISSCQFCHTPHLQASSTYAGAPMWNRTQVSATTISGYRLYGGGRTASGSVINIPGPTSLACLGCHDGTISVISVISGGGTDHGITDAGLPRTQANYVQDGKLQAGSPTLITDLSKQHPIGFDATQSARVAGITNVGDMQGKGAAFYLANGGKSATGTYMECGTCHDPHQSNAAYQPFLRLPKATICTECHNY